MNHIRITHWLDGSWAYALALDHDTTSHDQWWPGFATSQEALDRGVADLEHAREASHQYFVHLSLIWFRYFEDRKAGRTSFGAMTMRKRDEEIAHLRYNARHHPDLLAAPVPRLMERGRVEKHVPPPAKVRIKLNLETLR